MQLQVLVSEMFYTVIKPFRGYNVRVKLEIVMLVS